MLRNVEHPHIIKMRGFSTSGPAGFADAKHEGFFLILDCLGDTLNTRIHKTWKHQDQRNRSVISKFRKNGKGGQEKLLADRLKVAFDISAALHHLHCHDIVYRDLKPDNLGFDVRGDIKLFDFGLSKQLPLAGAMASDTFVMSQAGSLRYMAPEVMSFQPYNTKVDVYSFTILLWEMLALKKPYGKCSDAERLQEDVVSKHVRPDIDTKWPSPIKDLLEMGWDSDLHERPSMMVVENILRYQVSQLCCEDVNSVNHNRRRSMGSIGTVQRSSVHLRRNRYMSDPGASGPFL